MPCNPTIKQTVVEFVTFQTTLQMWSAFKDYNIRDVDVEWQYSESYPNFQYLKKRGRNIGWIKKSMTGELFKIDMTLADAAVHMDELSKNEINKKLRELTGLEKSK